MKTAILTLILIASVGAAAAAQITAGAPSFTVERFDIGGTGGADYLMAEPSSGRVFVSRQTHVMVVDGRTGQVLGDIPDTPGVRNVALAFKSARGFTTNAGDSTLSVFDLNTLAVLKKVKITAGLPHGIMYEVGSDRIVVTVQGRQRGAAVIIRPSDASIIGTVPLADAAPGAAIADDQGRIYVAIRSKNAVQVFDVRTLKVLRSLPTAPCLGPAGIDIDLRTSRLLVGCNKTSVAIDFTSGKVVSSWTNGDGVDGLAWDAGDHLAYVPSGRSGTITVVRMVSPNSFKVVSTIQTVPGARTIAHDPSSRVVYQFQPEGDKNWFVRISR